MKTLHKLGLTICLASVFQVACLQAYRLSINEAEAAGVFQSIRLAEQKYKATYGRYGTLKDLASCNFIGSGMASGERRGYVFEIKPEVDKYSVTAIPAKYHETGDISFYSDETGIIRYGDHYGQPGSANDSAMPNQD